MSDLPNPDPPPLQPARRLQASRHNEHLKLGAAAFDRMSTVVIGGAVFAPIFQRQAVRGPRMAVWTAVALVLQGAAQFMLYCLREET